jgi:two-component system phosphate regulon sensor histidine kinase PhoR
MIKQKEVEELKKIEEYRKEFIADLSHELKTPVFAAQGFIHTLLDGASEDPAVSRHFLEKAAKSMDRLDDLIQNLLVLSEIETGSAKMNKSQTDMAQVVQEVFEQLEEKAASKKIRLELSKKGPSLAEADPVRIQQVIRNLIENAIKYGKENGLVSVELENKKDQIHISVSDDGPGIPPGHQTRIFDRFYRIEKSRSKEKGGSGLGLAIVKRIVEAHGSNISLISDKEGGSAFVFCLRKAKG